MQDGELRIKFLEELVKRMKERISNKEDKVLERIRKDSEIACLHSGKTEKKVTMGIEYNGIMEYMIMKIEAKKKGVKIDPSEMLMEKEFN